MKLLLLSFLFLVGCAASKTGVTSPVDNTWRCPTEETPENMLFIESSIKGKTYTSNNGQYFKFNQDGSFEAAYNGVYKTSPSSPYYYNYTCTVTSTKFTVTSISSWYGYFYVTLSNPNIVKSNFTNSPAHTEECLTTNNEVILVLKKIDALQYRVYGYSGWGTDPAPSGMGYREDDNLDDYSLQ